VRLARAAQNWSTVEVSVESCRLAENSDSDGSSYTVEVAYRYTVDGRPYRGTRLAFGYGGSSGRAAHQAIADRLMQARTVVVRYDPFDPARAVLACGVNRSILFLFVFGATWLMFCIGFAALVAISWHADNGILATLKTMP